MSEDYSDYISDSSDASNNEFIFKIDLNTAASDQVFYTAKRSTTTNFQDNVKNQQTNLDIVASTIHFSGEDSHLRIITTEQSPKSGDGEAKARDRWIHIQTECISFEEFERRVKILTFDYHEDLVPVVVYLLKKIQKTHEEKSAYGGFIEPGTVFRVDGVDWKDRSKPDLSAIFVSFPYFDMGKWKPPDAPNNEALHLPRGLFQSSYSQENALDRDGNQIFRKFKGIKSDQYLRVPQLWVLILQSRTIITCGPSNLPDLFDDNVRFVEEEKLAANGPSLIQVTDFLRRTTYLPVDRCKTFLGLKQSIEQQCLSDTDFTMDDCLLHAGESEEELIGNI
ncbi:hypothetical protein K432DRAFT_190061 [Lepidopterella palustris CBS 459.81]|uniref:Uncharacterized protein n=1 Tax=Lepidopterella palustris CBS 459.81 TaxID=1314670 RepID=A0A8E2J9Z8_9PEZI|nr:hypothetical protein K432DRAFT_190061 [Lepidopterella palustris CBS 459.81]